MGPTLCSTSMVQNYVVHYQPALCTTGLHCASWCTRETYFFICLLVLLSLNHLTFVVDQHGSLDHCITLSTLLNIMSTWLCFSGQSFLIEKITCLLNFALSVIRSVLSSTTPGKHKFLHLLGPRKLLTIPMKHGNDGCALVVDLFSSYF